MINSNFISFPVSSTHFSKIESKPYDNEFALFKAIRQIFQARNFSQIELNDPYVQVESHIFIRSFILLKIEKTDSLNNVIRNVLRDKEDKKYIERTLNQTDLDNFLKNTKCKTVYDFIRNQFALLFLMESIFFEIQSIKHIDKLKTFFAELISQLFIPEKENSPADTNANNNNNQKDELSAEAVKNSLKKIFPKKDLDHIVDNFFSILKDELQENVFNFKAFRDWNKSEFPNLYHPLITDIAALLSNTSIHAHGNRFTELFAEQSCLNLNPASWFKQKVVTESQFKLGNPVKQSNDKDEIEMKEQDTLLKIQATV